MEQWRRSGRVEEEWKSGGAMGKGLRGGGLRGGGSLAQPDPSAQA